MSLRSETRRTTINDVAELAGVSRAAVSKVIRNAHGVSPQMRQRVTAAIAELGYRPQAAARALRGLSYRLGLEIPAIGARFMAPIVEGAQSALAGTPFHLVLAPAAGPEYDAIDTLADSMVDGMIAVSPLVATDWLEKMAERIPIVMLGRHDDQASAYDTVVGDDVAGTRLVMDHLLGLGHRHIAHVTESEAVTASGADTPHALRLRTYQECMTDQGLAEHIEVVRRAGDPERTREQVRTLLTKHNPPTAIFAGHDDIAIEILHVAHESPGPPRHLALVGYDNTDTASHPLISLSSVDQQGLEMGRAAATMLLERIAGRVEPRQLQVTASLRIRRSSGPPLVPSAEAADRPRKKSTPPLTASVQDAP